MITRINSRMDELCSRSALSLSQREKETDDESRDTFERGCERPRENSGWFLCFHSGHRHEKQPEKQGKREKRECAGGAAGQKEYPILRVTIQILSAVLPIPAFRLPDPFIYAR